MTHFIREYLLALQFFTRIPITGRLADWVGYSPEMLRASAAHFPGVGVLVGAVAAAVFALLQTVFDDDQFLRFGWRIAFAVSIVLVVIGIVVRLAVDETPAFVAARATLDTTRTPLRQLLGDPVLRDRLAAHSAEFEVMRVNAIRSLTEAKPGADNVAKLVWANWHRRLGEIAMDVIGSAGLAADGAELARWQRLFLFSRADTIYGGSDEIQRNIIAERVLGLPREARP